MRTEKELLEIMLDNIDSLNSGLCGLSCDLNYEGIISQSELEILTDYFDENLPLIIQYFSWNYGEKQPRIEWLKEQIEKLNNATN